MEESVFYCLLVSFWIKTLVVNWHAYLKVSICCLIPHITFMMWLKLSDVIPQTIATGQAVYVCVVFARSSASAYPLAVMIILLVDASYNLCKACLGCCVCPIWAYYSVVVFKEEDRA